MTHLPDPPAAQDPEMLQTIQNLLGHLGKDDLPVDGAEWLIDAAVQRPGLVLVASRPAMGRSAFLHRFLLRTQHYTALFNPLLTTEQVTLRLIAMQSGVSIQNLKRGQLHRPASLAAFNAVNVLAERELRFFTGTSLGMVSTFLGHLAAP